MKWSSGVIPRFCMIFDSSVKVLPVFGSAKSATKISNCAAIKKERKEGKGREGKERREEREHTIHQIK